MLQKYYDKNVKLISQRIYLLIKISKYSEYFPFFFNNRKWGGSVFFTYFVVVVLVVVLVFNYILHFHSMVIDGN